MLRLEASFCHTPPISALNALVDIESAQANLTGRCCHGPSGQYASMRGPFGVQSGHRSSSPYPIVPCRKVPRSCGFLSGKPRHGSELEIYERVRGWVMVGLIDHTKPPGAPHSREYYPNSITSVLWEMTRIRFSSQTKRHLGHYVYALVDPRDDAIFYVGKASGNNRAYDHLKSETSETSKNRRIKEIREAGAEPLVDILRYGLDTKEACFEVEAAIIDTLGLENLANSVRGHGIERGRQTAAEVERLYGSKPIDVADISERLMLFFINRTYSPTMPEIEIYDCVRQFWSNVGARRRTPDESGTPPYSTALGIADGVVVRAYSIAEWFPAGTTMSTRGFAGGEGRWEFVGQLLPDHPLVGRRLVDGDSAVTATQQGYRYVN